MNGKITTDQNTNEINTSQITIPQNHYAFFYAQCYRTQTQLQIQSANHLLYHSACVTVTHQTIGPPWTSPWSINCN